jgi:hypothetical protein
MFIILGVIPVVTSVPVMAWADGTKGIRLEPAVTSPTER